MLNKVILMGRLTRDPELRYTPQNVPVCTITLAVDRDFTRQGEQRETDFIDVVAWRSTAEFVSKWFRKGLLVACEGRLQTRKWKDKFEQNRVSFEVIADNVYFAERAGDSQPRMGGDMPAMSQPPRYQSYQAPQAPAPVSHSQNYSMPPASDFAELDDDDDVPF